MVTNLYRRLYTTEEVYQSFVISHVIPNLGEYGKDELRRTPISEEIYQIVRFMGSLRAPGQMVSKQFSFKSIGFWLVMTSKILSRKFFKILMQYQK